MAVNTDPYHMQWANIDLDLAALGLTADQPFQVHDLLTDARYRWQGNRASRRPRPRERPGPRLRRPAAEPDGSRFRVFPVTAAARELTA